MKTQISLWEDSDFLWISSESAKIAHFQEIKKKSYVYILLKDKWGETRIFPERMSGLSVSNTGKLVFLNEIPFFGFLLYHGVFPTFMWFFSFRNEISQILLFSS